MLQVETGFQLGMLNLGPILSHSCAIFSDVHTGSLGTPDGYVFGDVEAESTIKFGEYQHVVCTYDGLTVSLYVDGELVGTSGAQIGDIAYPPEDYSAKHSSALLTLGANHDANDYFTMHGELDEAMIFDCALPEDEIAAASAGRAATVSLAESNADCLMHWFRFNEDSGAVVRNDGAFGDIVGYVVDPLGNQVFRESSQIPG